ncbi:heme anaerobic degradation radical SAM methyltransferase ChuW/HutW [Succinivibrio dextrinosolvens]|uniref:heme anaerobic degradation radical SAM methyltransferase ChuW/HutW n=1 Tax=Succinivibrio dextrinosolvens TaxID=83771 RepID=UPI00068938C7|nr:heme anaerobic degradation radical SAM methyltransferase ChuW/HutW [Succinivibrio dextrinosolvens]
MNLSSVIKMPFELMLKKYTSENGEVDFDGLMKALKKMGKPLVPIMSAAAKAKGKEMPMEKMMKKMASEQNQVLDWKAHLNADPLTGAFEEKHFSHSSSSMQVVPPPFVPYGIDILSQTARTTRSAIYVNVPFCQTRCSFCMFYISPYKKEESRRYTDALIKEIGMWENSKAVGSKPIHAVYLGGGTPTALEACDLKRILQTIKTKMPLASDCEITVEGRLSYFTDEKIEACLEAGANRFSMGVQSFDTEVRKRMGRLSTKDELIKSLEHLCSYDSAAVIIDLMFGLPGQNPENFAEDLRIVKDLPIDGVDLYQLIMLEGSPLQKLVKAGKMPVAPSKEERALMYRQGTEYLLDNHFRSLSVSHFAKTFRERNLYNVLAKSDADTLAFGPGAGGKIQGVSFMNVRNYEEWLKKIDSGHKGAFLMFVPEKRWRLYKHLGEQMELGFIDWKFFEQRYLINLKDKVSDVINQWQEAGLLVNRENYTDLTLAGRFWAVTMIQLLTNYLQYQVFGSRESAAV